MIMNVPTTILRDNNTSRKIIGVVVGGGKGGWEAAVLEGAVFSLISLAPPLTYTALTHNLARSLHLPFEDTAPEVRETRPLTPLVPLAHDGVGREQDWKERMNE